MSSSWLFVPIFGAALGCGLIAGVFFALSAFVMKSLTRVPRAQGLAAMNSINVFAVTPLLITALFGAATGCLAVAVSALIGWQEAGAAYLLVGPRSISHDCRDHRLTCRGTTLSPP